MSDVADETWTRARHSESYEHGVRGYTRGVRRYGNVPSSVRALGLDVGSTHVKAAVVDSDGDHVRELAVVERPVARGDAAGLVADTLAAARDALARSGETVDVVGIASMAETGALVDADGLPTGPLLRWDRAADADDRLAYARALDAAELHAATGVPLTPKLPLLTWATLGAVSRDARWGFAADLVAAALTGRLATDHTLAGRSGALPLPPAGTALGLRWDDDLLAAVGVPATLPPPVRAPGEAVGTARDGILGGLRPGASVHIAGHDHAVVARLAGLVGPGIAAHSLGTTEAVLALAAPEAPIDRFRAGREGVSVVRGVDGVLEGALAGSPAAGRLVADWRRRATVAGADPDALLAERSTHPDALALPYPAGRQCPSPDPAARLELHGPDEPGAELAGILRGLAAHGAWMRALVADLCAIPAPRVVAAGTPVRANPRLAGLMASLAGAPLPVVDLDAPAATGAALLAAERAGLLPRVAPPVRLADPDDDGVPDLADRFAAALALPEGVS